MSRLWLVLTRRWQGGLARIAVAHALTLTTCTVLYGFGSANGGEPNFTAGIPTYELGVLVWLVLDVIHFRRNNRVVSDPKPA